MQVMSTLGQAPFGESLYIGVCYLGPPISRNTIWQWPARGSSVHVAVNLIGEQMRLKAGTPHSANHGDRLGEGHCAL